MKIIKNILKYGIFYPIAGAIFLVLLWPYLLAIVVAPFIEWVFNIKE